jgi:hypothetical protein
VADDQWDLYVDEDLSNDFMQVFEFNSFPGAVLEDAGIVDNDREVFGEFPDALDNDPRVYVLLMDIKDYVASDGDVFSFDGYFNSFDEMPDEEVKRKTAGLYRSNECEILYLNSRIRSIMEPYTLAVAAHELQHMINYNYDESDEVWMSESLAEVAMLVNGLYTDVDWVESYFRHPETPLVTTTASGSYGAYLMWGMYLYEQIGRNFMLPLEEEQSDGISGLNRALRAYGDDRDFITLFSDWVVANAVQDRSVAQGQFGYDFTDALPEITTVASFTGKGGETAGDIKAFAVEYIDIESINAGSTLTITPDTTTDFLARVVVWNGAGVTLLAPKSLPSGALSLELEGGTSNRYAVVLSNLNTDQIDDSDPVTGVVGYSLLVE